MPCYTVRLVSVEFKVENEKVLQAAAEALQIPYIKSGNKVFLGAVEVDLSTQTATSRDQTNINQLKVAYSQAAVKMAAKAKGWTLESWKVKAGIKSTVAVKY